MISGQKIPLKAGAAIAARRLVKVGSADRTVIQAAAAADVSVGVTEFDVESAATATVQVAGVALVEAGGSVSRGARVTADSAGKGVAASPATGANASFVGIALEGADSGDFFSVLIAPGSIQGA